MSYFVILLFLAACFGISPLFGLGALVGFVAAVLMCYIGVLRP